MENIYNYFLKLISFRSDNKKFENIEIFNGGYHDGFFTGKGKVNLNDGSVYEGEFSKSKMNGYGKIFFKDGSIYQGNFTNNLRDGTGILKNKDGIQERVVFKNGKYIGNFKEEFTIHWEDNVSGTFKITAKDAGEAMKIFERLSKDDLYKRSQWGPVKKKVKIKDISILSSNEEM